MKQNILEECTSMAKDSTVKRGKVGAVIYKDSGDIICRATNINVYGVTNKRSIHAEEYVIKKAEKIKLFRRYPNEKFNLLVVRWSPLRNNLGNAMPCLNCQKILARYKINVYFSNWNGEIKQFK